MDHTRVKLSEVLKQIVYKFRENNKPVADALVAYILTSLFDEKENKFYFIDGQASSFKLEEIKTKAMGLLSKEGDGVLETMKLQITYELSHIQEEDKVEQIKNYFDSELTSLLNEITSFHTTSKRDHDSIQLHKKIFAYLLTKTKQNTLTTLNDFRPTDSLSISSEKEIYAILDNVLPKSGLPPFASLSAQDKISQLNDLAHIVMGIRLLNAELGKGGIGLLTLGDLKSKLNTELLTEIRTFYNRIALICENYTINYEEKYKDWVTYYRQIMTYLSMMMDDLSASSQTVDSLSDTYEREINYLVDVVEKKSAMTKEQAYPRFENLSKMYSKFQEQSFILGIRENVFRRLMSFVTEIDSPSEFLGEENLNLINDLPHIGFEAGAYQNGVSILLPHTTADFMDLKLEYQGYCIVSLIKKEGLLVNGKPNIVAKFKDKYLVFYNNIAIQEFIENPQLYIDETNKYVRRHPYLICLLNLTEDFPNVNLSTMFRDKDVETFMYKSSSVMVDKEIQTVTHVHENGFIDPKYVWNEWELKKQALQLTDIMKKKTVSSQTFLSHFRRENEAQVWPLKEQAVNTTVSKGTNLSIPKSYVVDLRKK